MPRDEDVRCYLVDRSGTAGTRGAGTRAVPALSLGGRSQRAQGELGQQRALAWPGRTALRAVTLIVDVLVDHLRGRYRACA